MLDRQKLAKILARAESDHDAEALTAVRMAVKLARGAGMTLGQAVEGGAAAAQVREPRSQSAQVDQGAWDRGYWAGKRAGVAEAFGPMEHERAGFRRHIGALEAELEQYRPALDWKALARAYAEEGKRWGSAKAKAIAGRALRNELTVEDKITLRHFSGNQKQ